MGYNISVTHSTSGKEIVLEVEETYAVASVLEVLVENLQLKDRFVLATGDNRILNPEITLKEAGVAENAELILMPDPTGGHSSLVRLAPVLLPNFKLLLKTIFSFFKR